MLGHGNMECGFIRENKMVKIIGCGRKFKTFADAQRFAQKHNIWEHQNHYTEIQSENGKHILKLEYDYEDDEMVWKWQGGK